MRILLIIVLLSAAAVAQDEPSPAVSLKDVGARCGGAVLASLDSNSPDLKATGVVDDDPQRPGLSAFARAAARILAVSKRLQGNHVLVALISSSEISAWSVPRYTSDLGLVCFPTAMADFIGNEDEIAFVIGHEIGHTVRDCGISVPCETAADEIGFNLLWRAGYSPYAAAGLFGRLEMYSGEMQTGLMGSLHQAAMDHPITPKRIENMRRLLLDLYRKNARATASSQ
jgi:predicted Zn-dependent protease